jgi:hypothetical protein
VLRRSISVHDRGLGGFGTSINGVFVLFFEFVGTVAKKIVILV